MALHLVGPDGSILRANRAELDLLGYRSDEYIGRNIADFHADADTIVDILARLSRGEKLDKYPARLRAKDGSIRHVLISSNVQFRDGAFIHTRCFTLDVTEAHATRELLRDRERWFMELLEFLPAAVYTTDAEGRINFFNNAAVELAGRTPAIGDMWCVTWKLFHPDGTPLPHDECPMAIALKEKRAVRGGEAIAERPDGTRVPFIPFPTPLRDSNGEVIGAVNMLIDISERRQSETAQRVLVNELNHRVKNNMQMLDSLLKVALRKTSSPEAQAVLADACRRVATMAAAQRVLYEAGSMSFDAAQFVRAVCDTAAQAFENGIAIEIGDVAGHLSNDVALPLALILNELLVNAVKYGVNGAHTGTIRVGLDDDGECYQLVVKDNGPGFDLDDTRNRSSGLDIVSGLARQIGGKFLVQRDAGARRVVRFPHAPGIH